MPSGPRPPARPGAGPGRARTRVRSAPKSAAPTGGGASAATPTGADAPVAVLAARRPNVTTRAIALVVVLLVLVISYATSLRIYFSQAHEIASTRAEIVDRQQRIADLQAERNRWDNPDHVQTEARQRLGWVVPGETGFQVVGPDGQPLGGGAAIESAPSSPDRPQDAWWGKLWGSVQAADAPPPAKKKEPAIITPRTRPNEGSR